MTDTIAALIEVTEHAIGNLRRAGREQSAAYIERELASVRAALAAEADRGTQALDEAAAILRARGGYGWTDALARIEAALAAEADRPVPAPLESDEWKGAVGALANITEFVQRGKASLTPEDVSNLKAMLALDLSLIGKAFGVALAAEADRGTGDFDVGYRAGYRAAEVDIAARHWLDLDSPEAATPTGFDVLLIAGAPLLRDAYAAYIVRGWLDSPEAAERLARAIHREYAHPSSNGGLDWGIELYGSPNELAAAILAALREQGR